MERNAMKKLALLFLILCAGALNGMENPEQKQFLLYGNLTKDLKAHIITFIKTYDNLDDIINTLESASAANKELNKIVINLYDNLPGFTALIGVLKEKFPGIPRDQIAEKFGMGFVAHNPGIPKDQIAKKFGMGFVGYDPGIISSRLRPIVANIMYDMPIAEKHRMTKEYYCITKEYRDLGNSLIEHSTASTKEISKLINDGADVNFSTAYKYVSEIVPLFFPKKADAVKLLLDSGANPYIKSSHGLTTLDMIRNFSERARGDQLKEAQAIQKLLEDAMKNNLYIKT